MKKEITKKIPKKLSLYKRFSAKLNTYKKNFKKFKKTEDYVSTKEMVLDILLMGVLISFGATLFGIPFSFFGILAFGCVYWVFVNKIKDLIVEVIGSLQLVKIYR